MIAFQFSIKKNFIIDFRSSEIPSSIFTQLSANKKWGEQDIGLTRYMVEFRSDYVTGSHFSLHLLGSSNKKYIFISLNPR